MKALLVARKFLLETLREPQLLALEVGLPVIFLAMTLFMYNAPLMTSYAVWIYNPASRDTALVEELRGKRYPDGRPVFDITMAQSEEEAEAALKERRAKALLILAEDGTGYTLRGDAISSAFYRASTLLESALRRYSDRLNGRAEIVQIQEQALFATGSPLSGPQSQFDLYAPGMIVMAILLIIPQTAMLVGREIRWRTLRRLRLTRLNAWGLLAGVCLAQMGVALAQVLVIFFAALAMGFHNQGSLWLAILVGLALSFSSVGMGLIVACFVENDSQAANLGATLSMLQVFVSGAWFTLTPLTLFTLAGHAIDLFDIFPATSGFLALQQVLTFGSGLGEIGFRLGWALALSGVYFVAGVLVFQRTQMRRF